MDKNKDDLNLMVPEDQDLSRDGFDLININRLNLTDLDIYQCGSEDCSPEHFYGPAVRDHFLIHYVFSGQGIFSVDDRTYHLKAGEGFLICPHEITYYEANKDNPWTYAWIGFHGLKAETYLKQANLNQKNPIITDDQNESLKKIFKEIADIDNYTQSREVRLTGLTYVLLSQLIEAADENLKEDKNKTKYRYAKEAVDFIAKNYSCSLTISEIANHIGLDRSYLWSIFKEYFNLSPQEFLINFKIDKACELMTNQQLSIADIARSVGYSDPLSFSKTFKKIKGVPPSEYRKNNIIED